MAADRERGPVRVLDEPLGDPAAMDRHPVMLVRAPVEGRLELRLEEQVVRLPTRWRGPLWRQGHQGLAVGAEPVVLVQGDHLGLDGLGQSEGLQQPHDLVVEVDGTGHAVDLVEALVDAATR